MESPGRFSVEPTRIGPAVELSIANYLNGYNCAESVLLATASAIGLESEVVPGIATGFGEGLSREGALCGAISGGILAIGLARGRTGAEQKEAKEETYALSLMLHRRFKERFGTTICKELLREELSTPEQKKAAFEKRLHETQCMEYIAFATQTTLELLARIPITDEQTRQSWDG